jgi:hypothetical protein
MSVKLPTGMEIPVFVKQEFTAFYKAMFSEQVRREKMSSVFVEYAWDMAWCDPCAADPLSREELRSLGVFWLNGGSQPARPGPQLPGPRPLLPRLVPQNVFMTRLHVRYDSAHFPEDLVFQETADQETFQGRYVLRHVRRERVPHPQIRKYSGSSWLLLSYSLRQGEATDETHASGSNCDPCPGRHPGARPP